MGDQGAERLVLKRRLAAIQLVPTARFRPAGQGFCPSGPVMATLFTVGTARPNVPSRFGGWFAGRVVDELDVLGSGNVTLMRAFTVRFVKSRAEGTLGTEVIGIDGSEQRVVPVGLLRSAGLEAAKRALAIAGDS